MAGLIHLTHDADDFSEYTTATPTGTRLTTSASAGLNGTAAGIEFVVSGSSGNDGQVDPGLGADETIVRLGFYFDKNTLSITSGLLHFLNLESSGFNPIIDVFADDNSGIILTCTFNNDDGTGTDIDTSVLSSGERKIEIVIERAATDISSDGICTVFVDSVQQAGQITNFDNYDTFVDLTSALVQLKNVVTGTKSGTFYYDEIIIRNDATPIFPGNFSGYDLVLGGGQL